VFGLVFLLGLSGLSVPASILIAFGTFLVLTVVLSDRVVRAIATRRSAGSPVSSDAGEVSGDGPRAALSVVASRAKRLEYVPASSLMVPRRSIVGCESSATLEEAASRMRETGLSRVIAYSKNIDKPLGLAHIKDVLPKLYGRGGRSTVESMLRPLVLVPSSMRALDLLRDFQRLKRRLGIVRDLQGERTLGLVSAEDILEELVGEIHDEHEGPLLSALDSGVALVRADLKVEDLLEGLGVAMEGLEKEQTVGDLVRSSLKNGAELGNEIYFKDLRLTVEEMVDGEIWMVRIEKVAR
jgi:CBS domain containing-hemolysin-like protein